MALLLRGHASVLAEMRLGPLRLGRTVELPLAAALRAALLPGGQASGREAVLRALLPLGLPCSVAAVRRAPL